MENCRNSSAGQWRQADFSEMADALNQIKVPCEIIFTQSTMMRRESRFFGLIVVKVPEIKQEMRVTPLPRTHNDDSKRKIQRQWPDDIYIALCIAIFIVAFSVAAKILFF